MTDKKHKWEILLDRGFLYRLNHSSNKIDKVSVEGYAKVLEYLAVKVKDVGIILFKKPLGLAKKSDVSYAILAKTLIFKRKQEPTTNFDCRIETVKNIIKEYQKELMELEALKESILSVPTYEEDYIKEDTTAIVHYHHSQTATS